MAVAHLVQRTGGPAYVVCFYPRIGLLKTLKYPNNGYRLFSSTDAARLEFIHGAKQLDYTLSNRVA